MKSKIGIRWARRLYTALRLHQSLTPIELLIHDVTQELVGSPEHSVSLTYRTTRVLALGGETELGNSRRGMRAGLEASLQNRRLPS